MSPAEIVATLTELRVTDENYSEIVESATATDWSAAYDATDEHSDDRYYMFDAVEALYWHAVHWHSGQWSSLYALQCVLGSVYEPGDHCDGPEPDSSAQMVYEHLDLLQEEAS